MRRYAGGRAVTVLDRISDPVLRGRYIDPLDSRAVERRALIARDPGAHGARVPDCWVVRMPWGQVQHFRTWAAAYAWAMESWSADGLLALYDRGLITWSVYVAARPRCARCGYGGDHRRLLHAYCPDADVVDVPALPASLLPSAS